jgi:hypothetical protein
MSNPSVFVGSSVEQMPLVLSLVRGLRYKAVVTQWASAFPAGETTVESLLAQANQSDFAMFIFGPDDWVKSRSARKAAPRDNVVFEAGLFGGVLGMKRTIIVYDRDVKLPSDLLGLTPINYSAEGDPDREGDYVCAEMIRVIEKRGWRGKEGLEGQLQGDWWQYSLGASDKEPSVVSLITIARDAPRLLSLSGTALSAKGENHARFWSCAANVDESAKALFYYWEGSWPGKEGAPAFFGTGEIILENAQRGKGYFTVNAFDDSAMRARVETAYVRATEKEVAVMKGTDKAPRQKLIREQLECRESLTFS